VLEYAGLNFVRTHSFKGDTPEGTAAQRAQAKADEIGAQLGQRATLLAPTGDSEGATIRGDVDPISLNGGGSSCIEDAAPCSTEPAFA
jgi:hypothetical protein